jgi:tetratricopeptide (TPR) repeat protein
MSLIKRWLVRVAIVLATMMLSSCVTITHYSPDKTPPKTMSVGKARDIVEKYLQNQRVWYQTHFSTARVLSASVKPGGIDVLTTDKDKERVDISLVNVKISAETIVEEPDQCQIEIDDGVHTSSTFRINLRSRVSCSDITNALFILSQSEPQLREIENVELHFDALAKVYREASPKPVLPETAHRFKVQAEGAVNDKQFADAADYYEQAIEVAPWWPEGHFNRALVLGEIKEYQQAIIEMKRYILLVPNAPDARAVQDKIYDWERKADTQN